MEEADVAVALGLRRRIDDKHATELVTAADWALNEDKRKKGGLCREDQKDVSGDDDTDTNKGSE